ncbi:MAG: hypothetical protein WC208_06270 [Gallionella sp.]|jgi:hypothetical protein
MRYLVALVWLITTSPVFASACDGIDRSLSIERKAILAPLVTKQLAQQIDIQSAEVLESFRYKGWYILYVEPKTADEAFLFYNGDPATHSYLLAWPDAFSENDERNVLQTLSSGSTKRIPRPLARCFAWHVTQGVAQK